MNKEYLDKEIEQLVERIRGLKEEQKSISAEKATLAAEVLVLKREKDKLRGLVSGRKKQFNNLENELAGLKEAIVELKEKTVSHKDALIKLEEFKAKRMEYIDKELAAKASKLCDYNEIYETLKDINCDKGKLKRIKAAIVNNRLKMQKYIVKRQYARKSCERLENKINDLKTNGADLALLSVTDKVNNLVKKSIGNTLANASVIAEVKDDLLAAYSSTGTFTKALELVNYKHKVQISTSDLVKFRKLYPEFNAELETAQEAYKDKLKAALLDAAVNGHDKHIFFKGEHVDTVKVKSDRLMEVAVKGLIPEEFDRAKYLKEQGGKGNINVAIINYGDAVKSEEEAIGVVKHVSDGGHIERLGVTKPKDVIIDAEVVDE